LPRLVEVQSELVLRLLGHAKLSADLPLLLLLEEAEER
jgi:hypothetical protein